MNLFSVIVWLSLLWCFGCSNHADLQETTAVNRLRNALDGIVLDTYNFNSNQLARLPFDKAIAEAASTNRLLKERLTMGLAGKESFLFLNNNVSASTNPIEHGSEIAIILPDTFEKDGKNVGAAIRFDGNIVYFTTLRASRH